MRELIENGDLFDGNGDTDLIDFSVLPEKKIITPKEKKLFKPIEGELSQRQKNLIEDALAIEADETGRAGAKGYLARTFVQATLPHSDPKIPAGTAYSRTTGKLKLSIAPVSDSVGIPYGTLPRIILAWTCTEAVKTRERFLSLGKSQKEFLEKLQLSNNGRDIGRLKEQSLRLFKSVITVEYSSIDEGDHHQSLMISDNSHIFWHPKKMNQAALWDSTLELSDRFFKSVIESPVPFDLDVYQALSKSPMSMDVYTWLVYRMFILRRSGKPFVLIPWGALKLQFGAGYNDDRQGEYDFKANFKKRLREVLTFYPEARDAIDDDKKSGCLKMKPAALHIAHKPAKHRKR